MSRMSVQVVSLQALLYLSYTSAVMSSTCFQWPLTRIPVGRFTSDHQFPMRGSVMMSAFSVSTLSISPNAVTRHL